MKPEDARCEDRAQNRNFLVEQKLVMRDFDSNNQGYANQSGEKTKNAFLNQITAVANYSHEYLLEARLGQAVFCDA